MRRRQFSVLAVHGIAGRFERKSGSTIGAGGGNAGAAADSNYAHPMSETQVAELRQTGRSQKFQKVCTLLHVSHLPPSGRLDGRESNETRAPTNTIGRRDVRFRFTRGANGATHWMTQIPMTTASNDDALRQTITKVLMPMVAVDGGSLAFVRRHDDVVELRFSGACRGCAGQAYTLKGVVLPALQATDPTVRDVRAVW